MEKGPVPSREGGGEGGCAAVCAVPPAAGLAVRSPRGRSPGAPLHPPTMILWLCLCWGFSPSAAQPDSELMARYLEQQLLADYSIVQQVGFQAGGVREHQRTRLAWLLFTGSADKFGKNAFIPPVRAAQHRGVVLEVLSRRSPSRDGAAGPGRARAHIHPQAVLTGHRTAQGSHRRVLARLQPE